MQAAEARLPETIAEGMHALDTHASVTSSGE
jgi:hypothetical protein